jgi:putative lipoic acid-binding regulatory protein
MEDSGIQGQAKGEIMMERNPGPEELLQFPCDYMFKAFGPNEDRFTDAVRKAVSTHVPVSLDAVRTRPSREGTYLCVSILVRLHNFDQLKEVYNQLRKVHGLKYLL